MSFSGSDSEKCSVFYHLKYEHFCAGLCGGVLSGVILQPFDLLKVRLAANDGRRIYLPHYKGITNGIRTIIKQEGFRALYRGIIPNCFGTGVGWGTYLLWYSGMKSYLHVHNQALSRSKHALAAFEAGILTSIVTSPSYVIYTRLCLQYSDNISIFPPTLKYNGVLDAIIKTYRYEGVRGFYRGFIPASLGVLNGALQFTTYEELKKYYIYLFHPDKISPAYFLTFAVISKFTASSVTYPFVVVRTRLQGQSHIYNGIIDVIKKTWRFEGFFGFYKGLTSYCIQIIPNVIIIFYCYETIAPNSLFPYCHSGLR